MLNIMIIFIVIVIGFSFLIIIPLYSIHIERNSQLSNMIEMSEEEILFLQFDFS